MLAALGLSVTIIPWNLQQYDPLTQQERIERSQAFLRIARGIRLAREPRGWEEAARDWETKAYLIGVPNSSTYPWIGLVRIVPIDHPAVIYAPFWAPPNASEPPRYIPGQPPDVSVKGTLMIYYSYALKRWINWERLALQAGGIAVFGLLGIVLAGLVQRR